MIKCNLHGLASHILVKNRKLSYFGTILLMIFLLAAYLQQNRTEYTRYNWSERNRDLLSIRSNDDSGKSKSSDSLTLATTATTITDLGCKPKYNIVFIKTHKCASSTIQNIFMRNGVINNKVFVLPPKANYLGHPSLFNRSLVPDPKLFNHTYNILTHHSRLEYSQMRSLMPNDTVFITIVRDPTELFESMVNYYHLTKYWNISLDEFNDENFHTPIRVEKKRFIGKIGINQMMFDLGMNDTDFKRPHIVRQYIARLDSIFDLVMVSERMEESLVLLKQLLCWTNDDVVVFKINARNSKSKSNLTEVSRSKIKSINWADYQLYNHFKNKFSLAVKSFGVNKMKNEVLELRNRTEEWYNYCVGGDKLDKTRHSVIIRHTNKQKSNATCWLLTAQEMDFTKFLRIRQIKLFPGSVFTATDSPIKNTRQRNFPLYRNRMQGFIKDRLLMINPNYNGLICKKCMKSQKQVATTIDPAIELENAVNLSLDRIKNMNETIIT